MKDYEADIDQAKKYLGLPNWYFREIFGKFSSAWDNVPCSEIACCVSFEAGNLSKIYVSNYAEGMYRLYDAAGRFDHTPKLGDFIWFDYGAGEPEHTGRVIDIDTVNGYITTIEGNTNGGYVNQFTYSINDPSIFGYGHPNYTDQQYDTYEVRTESPAGEGLPEYNTVSSGGWNSNQTGTGAVTGANVLYSDIGYSQGRMIEMHNELFNNTIDSAASNIYSIFNVKYSAITDSNNFSWVHGGLGWQQGNNSTNQAFIRSDYIYCHKGSTINVDTGYKFTVCVYTSNSQSSYYTGRSASISGVYNMPIDGYIRIAIADTNNTIQTDFGIKEHFKLVLIQQDSWIRIAQDNGYTILNTPDNGTIAVWSNDIEEHVANIEENVNDWYVSESYNDNWYLSKLDSNNDYKPPILAADPDWKLKGFIQLFTVPYPPIGTIPEVPEAPKPYKKKIFTWLKRRPF